MVSGKLDLPTVELLKANFKPTYDPFFANISERVAHPAIFQEVDIREVKTLGDITARKVGVGDTEMKQALSHAATKTFNKEYKRIKYTTNVLQDQSDFQGIVNRVVNAHMAQLDAEIWGSTDNNGFYGSSDPDYVTNSGTAMTDLDSSFAAINDVLLQSEAAVGNGHKIIAIYAAFRDLLKTFNSEENDTYLNIIKRQFSDVTFLEVPSGVLSASEKGFLCIADGLVRLHYTQLPQVINRGTNEEGGYNWVICGYGTTNIEVVAPGAIIQQPKS